MSLKKIIAALITVCTLVAFMPMTSLADYNGWHQDKIGWKYYTIEDGFIRESWKQIGGKWYYFTYSCYMVASAENFEIDGKFYNFSSSGECMNPSGKTKLSAGWNKISYAGYADYDERWRPKIRYYWVYVGSDGEFYTGWQSIGGKWYYFSKFGGQMYTCSKGESSISIDNNNYILKENSGDMVTGWYYDGVHWFYARPNGVIYSMEWLYSGGKWYYFDYSGCMICNAVNYEIKGVYYSFDSSGACINPSGTTELGTGWVKRSYQSNSYEWFYYYENGDPHNGWEKIDGKWYYFSDGRACTYNRYIDGKEYYFNKDGQMVTGWFKYEYPDYTDNNWRYAGSDGAIYQWKWLNQGGKWYYFDGSGIMLSGVDNYLIDDVYYSFDSSGACKNPYATSEKRTGWFKVCYDRGYFDYQPEPDWMYTWVYFDSNGEMYKDKWLNYCGKWYYFNPDGYMANYPNYYVESEVKVYDFDTNGVCMNPNNPREPYLS